MIFHVMTLFPELIEGYMNSSIMKRAVERELIGVRTWNIRDYSENKHKKVDDYPYGGGAGMVMMIEPILNCIQGPIHTKFRIGDVPLHHGSSPCSNFLTHQYCWVII